MKEKPLFFQIKIKFLLLMLFSLTKDRTNSLLAYNKGFRIFIILLMRLYKSYDF